MKDGIILKSKKPANLTDVAYDVIKNNICNNQIEAGSLLSEGQIAKDLGMSRTPVREALRLLEKEDLVTIRVGVGAYVKEVSYKQLRELYDVRKAMEVLAIRSSMYNIEKDELDKMENTFRRLLEKHKETAGLTVYEFVESDHAFHKLIIDRCENRYVQSFTKTIMNNVKRIQIVSFQSLNNLEESTEQHLRLIKRIREKDMKVLEQELADHIDWSLQCIKEF